MVRLSDILLTPSVFISLFLEVAIFILLSYAFYFSIFLLKNYKQDASTTHYVLEKKSYLLVTIISVSMLIKLLLLPIFFSTLDGVSNLIPGAMCSAGVVSANSFGNYVVAIKIFIILASLLWLRLNAQDEVTHRQPYFKLKLYLYLGLYLFISLELLLEINFFTHLPTDSPVLCCSSIYTAKESGFFLSTISVTYLFIPYLLVYLSLIVSNQKRKKYFSIFLSLIFTYLSYYLLVYFLGTYIYELPTHKCPYCMLQKDYYFIGYLIYFSLFMGVYYSLSAFLFDFSQNDYKKSSLFFSLYFLLSLSNFILYLLKNHTLL